jgi:hypothetical protein
MRDPRKNTTNALPTVALCRGRRALRLAEVTSPRVLERLRERGALEREETVLELARAEVPPC